MAPINVGFLHYTDMKKILKKNFFLWNHWSNFEIISHDCSLGDPIWKLLAKFWSVNRRGPGEWGLFALYGFEEIIKKIFLLRNPWSVFEII